jgi:4-hydroxybenzoate polyprenyltransferase
MLVCLAASSLVLSALVSWWTLVLVLSYFILNVLYSWKLKHVVILDVFVISAGFMLRLLAGTLGLGIPPSAWLLLCGMMITLFLGFSKRFSELLVFEPGEANGENTETRRVLDDYSKDMLGQLIAITAACSILSYGFYTVSPRSVELHDGDSLIYTVPFVAYGVFRYLFLVHRQFKGTDVARDLLADGHMLTIGVVWLALTFWAIA